LQQEDAQYLSGFFDAGSPATLVKHYGSIAAGLLISMAILAVLTPFVRRLMGRVH
jgi:hypothetical protein